MIDAINAGPRPLALYPFDHDAKKVQTLLDQMLFGGVSVNDALMHVGQHDLPFGGVDASGMGHYHGHEASTRFPCCGQCSTRRFLTLRFLIPPYGKFADPIPAFLTR